MLAPFCNALTLLHGALLCYASAILQSVFIATPGLCYAMLASFCNVRSLMHRALLCYASALLQCIVIAAQGFAMLC